MRNTLIKLIVAAGLLTTSLLADSTNYTASLSTGYTTGVQRYAVNQAGSAAEVAANIELNGVPYVSHYYVGATVDLPFAAESKLTVLSTGIRRELAYGFSAQAGVEYAIRDSNKNDFLVDGRLVYSGLKVVDPYVGYGYDFNNRLQVAEAGVPFSFNINIPYVPTLGVRLVAAYGRYESVSKDIWQSVRGGAGLDVHLFGPLNAFADVNYFHALEKSSVTLDNKWLGTVGIKAKF